MLAELAAANAAYKIIATTIKNGRELMTFAAGELLERCNLPRGAKPDNFDELIKRDLRGDAVGDRHMTGGEH